jgi:hypothetical protein
VPRPVKIKIFTKITDTTVNDDIINTLYPLGIICLLNIIKNDKDRRAAIESEEIIVALAIIFPA